MMLYVFLLFALLPSSETMNATESCETCCFQT